MEAKCWFCGRTAEMVAQEYQKEISEHKDALVRSIEDKISKIASPISEETFEAAKEVEGLADSLLQMKCNDVLDQSDALSQQYVGVERLVTLIELALKENKPDTVTGWVKRGTVGSLADGIKQLYPKMKTIREEADNRLEKTKAKKVTGDPEYFLKPYKVQVPIDRQTMISTTVYACEVCRQLARQCAPEPNMDGY